MSIEEAMMGGIVFKGKKEKPKEENKIKTKAKKKTYITGLHGSGAAKMKAEIRKKRANRHKGKKQLFFQIRRCKSRWEKLTPSFLYHTYPNYREALKNYPIKTLFRYITLKKV